MEYGEAVEFLNSLSRFGWRLGLERMEFLCDRLGHPERAFDSIHIAGTNGKGSTATFLARILQAAGFSTGLYTSPHLYSGRERVQVNGEMIEEAEVSEAVEELIPHIRETPQPLGPVTEFEAWTTAMFLHFRRRGVQAAVIEAGLGGRWDSTNVIQPRLAVLTNVSMDHADRLGGTIAEIARDKAGIIKPGGNILLGPLPAEARAEALSEARQQGASLFSLVPAEQLSTAPGGSLGVSASPGGAIPETRYGWETRGRSQFLLFRPEGSQDLLSYSGPSYQARNAALAAAATCILQEEGYGIPLRAVEAGLAAEIPGRFQVILTEPEVILDAAHNVAAAAVLAAELAHGRISPLPQPPPSSPPELRIVFGGSSGHDVEGCLRILAPLAQEVILTRARNPRSLDPEALAHSIAGISPSVEVIPDVAAAVAEAVRRSRAHDRVCVTGSFFVLGEVPAVLTP